MGMTNHEIMQQLLEKFKTMLPDQEIKPEPETSTRELLKLEKEFKINTSDLINRNRDISHIPEEIIRKWESTFKTFKIMKGSIKKINSHTPIEKEYVSRTNEYLENPNKKANPQGFAFLFI